jgi:hypothetical protein
MLLYEYKQKSKDRDVETRAYLNMEDNLMTFYQYTFKGPEVLQCHGIDIPLEELTRILKIATKVAINNFLKEYKAGNK